MIGNGCCPQLSLLVARDQQDLARELQNRAGIGS